MYYYMKDSKYTTHLYNLFLQNLFSLESKTVGILYLHQFHSQWNK